MTDEELVQAARRGDPDAFDQLVARHQAAVYRAALAALRAPEDAEEAAQDAFVRAWKNLDRFRGDSSFRTWMLTIVWNRSMSKRRTIVNWLKRATALEDAPEPVTTIRRQDDRVHDDELQRCAVRAIGKLTPKLRDVLLLAQSGDYSYGEIAEMLEIPLGTVKWRVAEARKHVRRQMAGAGYVDAR